MKKYPRIGSVSKGKPNTGAKCKCGKQGLFFVEIQYNYMRGDDDVVRACHEHKKDLEYLLN